MHEFELALHGSFAGSRQQVVMEQDLNGLRGAPLVLFGKESVFPFFLFGVVVKVSGFGLCRERAETLLFALMIQTHIPNSWASGSALFHKRLYPVALFVPCSPSFLPYTRGLIEMLLQQMPNETCSGYAAASVRRRAWTLVSSKVGY